MKHEKKKINCSNTEKRLKLKQCLSSCHTTAKTFLCLSRSLKPPCWGQKTRLLKRERKSKSAPILKGNLKQRRIKHNTQTLYKRCGWRSTRLIKDELFLLFSGGDQTLVKTDLQSWEAFRESDLSWIIFCKLAVMRTFKHIIWCARNSNYGHGRRNFTFTLTHTVLLKGTEVLVSAQLLNWCFSSKVLNILQKGGIEAWETEEGSNIQHWVYCIRLASIPVL